MNKREGIHILKGKVMAVLCAVMAAVVLFSALSPAVYAQTDEERIKELQRQADELQKKIDAANEQLKKIAGDKAQEQKYINELNAQIEALQKQINAYNSSIDIIDSQIKSLDNQIIETKSKISKKEAEIQKF